MAFRSRASLRRKDAYWFWNEAITVQFHPPSWNTPILFRVGPWELKMLTWWHYAMYRRPWTPEFFEAPYYWSRVGYSRYIGGTGRLCQVWRWGWFSLHWLGPAVVKRGKNT